MTAGELVWGWIAPPGGNQLPAAASGMGRPPGRGGQLVVVDAVDGVAGAAQGVEDGFEAGGALGRLGVEHDVEEAVGPGLDGDRRAQHAAVDEGVLERDLAAVALVRVEEQPVGVDEPEVDVVGELLLLVEVRQSPGSASQPSAERVGAS